MTIKAPSKDSKSGKYRAKTQICHSGVGGLLVGDLVVKVKGSLMRKSAGHGSGLSEPLYGDADLHSMRDFRRLIYRFI